MKRRLLHSIELPRILRLSIAVSAILGVLLWSTLAWGQDVVGIYSDASGTDCNILPAPNWFWEFFVIHTPTVGALGSQFSAPLPAAFTASGGIYAGEQVPWPVFIGDSQTGIAVGYGQCLTQPVHVMTIWGFHDPGLTPACTPYPVLPDPNVPSGEIVIADCVGNELPGVGHVAMINGDASCPCGFVPGVCDIAGPDPVCAETVNAYTATPPGTNPTYTWFFNSNTSGASFVGGNTGISVDVDAGNAAGSYELRVDVVADEGFFSCSLPVTVNALPVVTCGDDEFDFGAGVVSLAGLVSPSGGTFIGDHVDAAGNFDVDAAGAGVHFYLYGFTDANGCTSGCSGEITVSAPPNLEIVSFSGPSSATVQDDVSGGMSLTITNTGSGDITTTFFLGFYHSTDDVIDDGDLLLEGGRQSVSGLLAGESVNVPISSTKIPFDAPLGSGYLGVILDDFDDVVETSETDNTASSPITLSLPDPVGEVVVYFDEALTQREADCPGPVLQILYVVAENLNAFISGIEYKIEYPPMMEFIADVELPPVSIGDSQSGISIAYGIPQDAFGQLLLHKVLVQWTCDDCAQFNEPVSVVPHPIFGYVRSLRWPDGLFILSVGATSSICVDSDGDGVFNGRDLCAGEDASYFDADGDGCIDFGAGNRHVEYWRPPDFPVTYVINQNGAPGIPHPSDYDEVQAGVNVWNGIAGSQVAFTYGGLTAQKDAQAMDGVNLVTFIDPDQTFFSGVLALGIATSFTEPTFHEGQLYLPGQIFDVDMIFNPTVSFSVGGGAGPSILDVTAHEAGHWLGLSHSVVLTSTMAYILTPGAETLEADDTTTLLKAYGDPGFYANASQLGGRVTNGFTDQPIPGAIVFAIDAASSDTSACAITRDDGSYIFLGLPDGDYFLATHPLSGTSAIAFIKPININPLVFATAQTDFVPEYWDLAESKSDVGTDKDAVTVTAGIPVLNIDFVTNVDETPPTVTSVAPVLNEVDVPIGGPVSVKFSEPIAGATVSGNFSVEDTTAHEFIGGNAFLLKDDSLLSFVPIPAFSFETVYEIRVKTGLTDKFNNALASDFVSYFTTEAQPPVFISNLDPNSGVEGAVITIYGGGFEPDNLVDNVVDFNGVTAPVSEAKVNRLVVNVPAGATTGLVRVTNQVQGQTSNPLNFTVITAKEVAKGFDAGSASVGATPRAITLLPDASLAFVATSQGFSYVVTDANQPDFLASTSVAVTGGLRDVDATPLGKRVYAVSGLNQKLYRINSDPNLGPIAVENEVELGAEPLGVFVGPSGQKAYVVVNTGRIQVWDIVQGSTTFEQQIGAIISPDANLRGSVVTNVTGGSILVPTGTGKLLVFDIATGTLLANIPVGFDPRDVVVGPLGNYAYVSDDRGFVSVVSMTSLTKVQEVSTGGTPRAIDITPSGSFLFVVNREQNVYNVIDLRIESPNFRKVVANIGLGTNPTKVEIGSDGLYAFSVSEAEAVVKATAIGLGPTLNTLSRIGGPVGTRLVLTGEGFTDYATTEVSFNGVIATPDLLQSSVLVVTAPPGAASGPVTVVGTNEGTPTAISNALFYNVLGPTPPGGIRISGAARPVGAPQLNSVIALSPTGDFAAVGGATGFVYLLDTDPDNPTFNQFFDEVSVPLTVVDDIAITPDGERAIIVEESATSIPVVNVDRLSAGFKNVVGSVDLSGIEGTQIARVAVSPDGRTMLVSDPGLAGVYVVDIEPGSAQVYEITNTIVLAGVGGANGEVWDMAFHPAGRYAYLPVRDELLALLHVLDMETETIVGQVLLPGPSEPDEMPLSIAFTSDGLRCLVLTSQIFGIPNRTLVMLNTSDPVNPVISTSAPIAITTDPTPENVRVSPSGDRAVVNIRDSGYYVFDITSPTSLPLVEVTGDVFHHLATLDFEFAPDESDFYSVSAFRDTAYVQDFSVAQTLALESGDGQSGVANNTLASPIEVKATVSATGEPAEGVVVTFDVIAGGGTFVGSGTSTRVVVTDDDGVAGVQWTLGPDVGAGVHQATATAPSLSGSPVTFTADGVVDPNTLPLELTSVAPTAGTIDVSVSTTMQTRFSRAVDPASIDESTLFFHAGDMVAMPVVYGFADENRRVSMTPVSPLDNSTTYTIEMKAGILDASAGPLSNPQSASFTTVAPAPPVINSISPVSGTQGITVVISGSGFDPDPADNTVTFFNNIPAFVSSAGVDFLNVTVPLGAVTGPVDVEVAGALSNTIDFTVLIPQPAPVDDVIGNVGTGQPTRSIGITPDGTRAYAVGENSVVPINVDDLSSEGSIPVGQDPVSIIISADGNYAYVANFASGTVTIIDVNPASPDFQQPIDNLPVGSSPIDLALHPDGDRLFVANAGSGDLSIVDADFTSETFHQVIGNVAAGGGGTVRSIGISPDGTRLYVGTDDGYDVLSTLNFGVIGNVGTGGDATRSISITPDGTKLVLLSVLGQVVIFDISPGSSTENQIIGNVGTGGGETRSVSITPDGTQLWAVQEESDVILVFSLQIGGGISVVDGLIDVPPTAVDLELLATVEAGEDPAFVVFDPTGSGVALISNPGDENITVLDPEAAATEVTIQVSPRTLQLDSRGRWVAGWIEPANGFTAEDIDIASVQLLGPDALLGGVPAELQPWKIEDSNMNGIDELHLKFDRVAFEQIMPQGERVPVQITGMALSREFVGEDTIRTIRPTIKFPNGGEVLLVDQEVSVTWDSPDSVEVDAVDVYWTGNDGGEWYAIADSIPDTGSAPWTTPAEFYAHCRVMVTLYNDGLDIGSSMSQGEFFIEEVVAVTLGRFDILQIRRGARLQWTTLIESGSDGFHILRSQNEEFGYERITTELIPARGERASYQFDDDSVRPNQTYYYRLEEIASGRPGQVFGPYKFVYVLKFALEQNVPNPFNPTTLIRFSLPDDSHVSLIVYDVAGRRVRTLVNEKRRADHYEVKWDGTNDNGQSISSGVYFYRIEAGKHRATRKMVMLK